MQRCTTNQKDACYVLLCALSECFLKAVNFAMIDDDDKTLLALTAFSVV